jgi:hypothetical protein
MVTSLPHEGWQAAAPFCKTNKYTLRADFSRLDFTRHFSLAFAPKSDILNFDYACKEATE